ncbi:hypothetical protein [Polyangium jinanense]|uniref:Uncharacterized protein n=1 Tax=Polyangium jinanense TaxID=2829994 RepID=A0A9X3XEW0_9BACT|nr:hypothetical protein [Polyangium jinanense]MDC3962328.1 hypothetical protein [Polyangium jinanense]MDC3989099.1 hypothetical protein [Polyangium jinanense]
MPPSLVLCSACGCHARSTESECPHCGARLRGEGGTPLRSAAALLLGLTLAAAAAEGCVMTAAYGGPPIDGSGGGGKGGEGGAGGESGAGGAGGGQDAGTD